MSEPGPPTRLRSLRPYTTRFFNPISRLFIYRLPGFAIISYTGRKSGKTFRTPMNAFRRGESYIFALTYGPDVQWVRNVLASGVADLQVGSRHIGLSDPVLFEDPTRHVMPLPVRFVLGVMRVNWFLRMSTSPRHAEAVPRGACSDS
jgi:deazaflavin-dependent oxidoreductase (nitroreductase family)